MNTLFVGKIIHCVNATTLEICEYLHVVGSKIVYSGNDEPDLQPETEIVQLSETELLIPGFVDTHIHAPQYPNIGLGYDEELLEWLVKYTFPLESKFEDVTYAEQIYRRVVNKTLQCGTTTACYYGTTHLASNLKLVEIAIELGQRCFVGHVNIYIPNTSVFESVRETKEFVEATLAKKSKLVKPIITPRSPYTCNKEMLDELGLLAERYALRIQTHLSENKRSNERTLLKYPGASNCTEILLNSGLLTHDTILAHCVHLSDDEKKMISATHSSISHCPSSNTYLHSGVCDIRNLIGHDIKCSLGSDLSAGPNPSMMHVMRSAFETATHLDFTQNNSTWLKYTEIFYLATLGGADAVGLYNKIGNFGWGKDFDALVIDANRGFVDCTEDCSATEMLQKFIVLGDDRNVKRVYVAGKCVKKK